MKKALYVKTMPLNLRRFSALKIGDVWERKSEEVVILDKALLFSVFAKFSRHWLQKGIQMNNELDS